MSTSKRACIRLCLDSGSVTSSCSGCRLASLPQCSVTWAVPKALSTFGKKVEICQGISHNNKKQNQHKCVKKKSSKDKENIWSGRKYNQNNLHDL